MISTGSHRQGAAWQGMDLGLVQEMGSTGRTHHPCAQAPVTPRKAAAPHPGEQQAWFLPLWVPSPPQSWPVAALGAIVHLVLSLPHPRDTHGVLRLQAGRIMSAQPQPSAALHPWVGTGCTVSHRGHLPAPGCQGASPLCHCTSMMRSWGASPAASAGESGSTARTNCPGRVLSLCRLKP